jgi:GT2 family glycosyltransferase
MPCVDIVIVNWNGCKYLGPCLDALAHQTFTDFQVWLVDNGSTDGSLELLRAQYPQVHLICNSHNRGFAAANNQGFRASNAKYVATLNNDTLADAGWLEALVHVLDENPHAGMAASMMLFADRPEVINSAGIAIDRAGIAWDLRGGELVNPDDVRPAPVFGACAGAPREDFVDPAHVDLAWRAQWAGWQALSVPQARVRHHHSATGGEGSPFKNRLLGRNKVWLIAKNYPTPYLWLYLPLIVGYDVAAVMYALIVLREVSALSGRLEGLKMRESMCAKRRTQVSRISKTVMLTKLAPLEPLRRVLRRYQHIRQV